MVKVSIIIPVYNTEKFLKKCLESLVNQTLKEIEIICIDDGSKDNSWSILEEFAAEDERIKLLQTQGGGSGPSVARNLGIENAAGEYVGFMDSDDWVDLDYFEKLYNAAKKYDTDLAVAGIKRVRSYKWKYHIKFDKEEVVTGTDEKFWKCEVPLKCYIFNKIYRLEELKKHKITFEEGIYFEDRMFTTKALYYLGSLVTVAGTYYNYWTNSNSIVKTKNAKRSNDVKYTETLVRDFVAEHNINDYGVVNIKRHKCLGITGSKVTTLKDRKVYKMLGFINFCIKY